MEIINKNSMLTPNELFDVQNLLHNSSLTFSVEDIYLLKNLDDKANFTNEKIEKILFDNVVFIKEYVDDKDTIIGCGFRFKNLLKYIAVNKNFKGENLSDKIISNLTKEAFEKGIFDLFLFTKPSSVNYFANLGFNLIIESNNMAMMENKKNKLNDWLDKIIEKDKTTNVGSIVMNANPMTLGHKYLIEYASKYCDFLYVFILSNDVSMFKTKERYKIVKSECENMPNVKVIEGNNYIISPATFPSYFIKDKTTINKSQMVLDCEIFGKLIAPKLNITKRFVGTEPFSETTNCYNETLKEILPHYNIKLNEINRLNNISATTVRALIEDLTNANEDKIKNSILENIKNIVTNTTYEYILNKYL